MPSVIMLKLFLLLILLAVLYGLYKVVVSLFSSVDKDVAIKNRKDEIKDTANIVSDIQKFQKKNRDDIEAEKKNDESIYAFINNETINSTEEKGEPKINLEKSE